MEQLLHYTWKLKLFPLKELLTSDGMLVEVIDPGKHNSDAGPDFVNAKIRINGTMWAGNVEIHDKSSDWYVHGHDKNRDYDNVILHVARELDTEVMKSNGQYEVVYSFGWYLRKMIDDAREKGATPILVSLTPRNIWKNGKIERRNDTYGKWYREIAEEMGVELIDVHNITADKYDKKGEKKVKDYFNHDHTHSSLKGAIENARSIRQGLKKMRSPLAAYVK